MKNAQILKGSVELALLGLLKRKKKLYGYQITQELKKGSNEILYVHEGTLYPMLRRLEKKGLIKGWWGKGTGKRRIHFYKITKKGEDELTEKRKFWKKLNTAVGRLIR